MTPQQGQGPLTNETPLILHVVESYAGGVKVAIDDYVRNAPEYVHALLYAPRADAPLGKQGFATAFKSTIKMPGGHRARIGAVRRARNSLRPSIIHAHSSFAGAYVRLAVSNRHTPIVYTPHCYAFERADHKILEASVYRFVELLLRTNTTAIAACSPREYRLSYPRIPSRLKVSLVPNVVPQDHYLADTGDRSRPPKTIVGSGRASAQKDPDFFRECVRVLREAHGLIEATWIGGDDALAADFRADGITVTGWVPRDEAIRLMKNADAYLHTARWEGFPLAILEAVALRRPAIIRKTKSYEGMHFPLTINEPKDVAAVWSRLMDDAVRQHAVDDQLSEIQENNDAAQSAALQNVYSQSRNEVGTW